MLNKKKVAFFSLVAVAAFWLVWVLVRPANVVRLMVLLFMFNTFR
ncbi:hypothetical protein IC615_25255 [Serratia ureilytica]